MAKGGQTAKSGAPAMVAAWGLFEAGDKKAARDEAARVLASAPAPQDAEEARELLARLAPPPVFKYLALLAAGLIATLLGIAITRGG